jgi:hypothetical protein
MTKIKIFILLIFIATKSLGQVDSAGVKKCIQTPDTYNGQPVYLSVDKSPEYKGGISQFAKYIMKNLTYGCREKFDKTVFYTTFIIDTTGNVQNVCTITNKTYITTEEKEIKATIEKSPSWTPGRHKNKNVCVRVTIPVRVCLK